jgi:hypothetical protein
VPLPAAIATSPIESCTVLALMRTKQPPAQLNCLAMTFILYTCRGRHSIQPIYILHIEGGVWIVRCARVQIVHVGRCDSALCLHHVSIQCFVYRIDLCLMPSISVHERIISVTRCVCPTACIRTCYSCMQAAHQVHQLHHTPTRDRSHCFFTRHVDTLARSRRHSRGGISLFRAFPSVSPS